MKGARSDVMPAPGHIKDAPNEAFTFTGDLRISYLGHATQNCPRPSGRHGLGHRAGRALAAAP
jgi:hypothetical protein